MPQTYPNNEKHSEIIKTCSNVFICCIFSVDVFHSVQAASFLSQWSHHRPAPPYSPQQGHHRGPETALPKEDGFAVSLEMRHQVPVFFAGYPPTLEMYPTA